MMDYQVMTCNLRVNVSIDGENAWPHRVSSVVELFERHRPTVIGTQEGLLGMLQDIDAQLSGYGWIGHGRDGGPAGEYVAIFYRTEDVTVVDSGHFWLSLTPDVPSSSWETACPRMCTWGHFRSTRAPFTEFVLLNTHLDHVSQLAREEGAKLIVEAAKRMSVVKSLPVMVTGDMNCHPDNPVIDLFRGESGGSPGEGNFLWSAYDELQKPVGATFHGFSGGEQGEPIDYVFLSRECDIVHVQVDRDRYAGRLPSDHYPVIVSVRLPS